MKKANVIRLFKESLPVGQWMDYWSVEQMWSGFTDSLCKNGDITQNQFNNWLCPVKYGRTVAVTNDGRFIYRK